jgi:uncharacterized membrane protein
MLSWLCLAVVVMVAAGMTLIPVEILQVNYPTLFYVLIIGLTLGWLCEVWSNRKKIRRKMALLVFLGYAVWVAITEMKFEFSDTFCRWESIIMVGAVLFAAMFAGGCHESDT